MRTSLSDPIDRECLLTSHEASALIQVNPSTINKWVEEGRLHAFRTPGGHRRIRAEDLASFLSTYGMPIPRSLSFARKRRLLVVDDEERQLGALGRLFESWATELEVLLMNSGIDALLRVAEFNPDLIVLDEFMPNVDGLAVCRGLKGFSKTRDIEIILASAGLTPAIEAAAAEAGAAACMHKPLDVEWLITRLGLAPRRRAG